MKRNKAKKNTNAAVTFHTARNEANTPSSPSFPETITTTTTTTISEETTTITPVAKKQEVAVMQENGAVDDVVMMSRNESKSGEPVAMDVSDVSLNQSTTATATVTKETTTTSATVMEEEKPREEEKETKQDGAQEEEEEEAIMKYEVRDSIVLEPWEQAIFDKIKRCVDDCKLKVTIRVAGGWVRDKLLGRQSDDIDLALEGMTGADFANIVHNYLEGRGDRVSHVGIIRSNPDQSKHLETATFRIDGVNIDGEEENQIYNKTIN